MEMFKTAGVKCHNSLATTHKMYMGDSTHDLYSKINYILRGIFF